MVGVRPVAQCDRAAPQCNVARLSFTVSRRADQRACDPPTSDRWASSQPTSSSAPMASATVGHLVRWPSDCDPASADCQADAGTGVQTGCSTPTKRRAVCSRCNIPVVSGAYRRRRGCSLCYQWAKPAAGAASSLSASGGLDRRRKNARTSPITAIPSATEKALWSPLVSAACSTVASDTLVLRR